MRKTNKDWEKETIDVVAKAICESTEADNWGDLSEDSIIKAIYRQQAKDAIKAYKKQLAKLG